jgi:hypothetical protein
LISNEINTTDTYVSSQDCSKIFNNSSLIESNSNNIYTLSTPCINNVRFKDNDLNFNEQYGVYDLTDDKLFNQYIELITSYGEIGDQSLLNSDQYKIHRNSKEGTITISFVINGQQYNSTYKGFKKDQQIPNINAGTLDQHLICDDLNQDKIIDLLKANNFDSQVINNLHFKITNIDNVNGEVEVLIDECKKTDLQEDYLNKSFKVVNLKPYYFEFIKKIDKSVLKRKPSSISENDYKKYFIHSSGEFNTRHMNDLKIILKSDDIHSKLDVEVSYTDLQTKYPVELKQEYNLNGNDKYHLIYYIIGGLGFLVILLVVMFFMEKRIKLRHQMPGCQ